jgi:hypothetical protein
MRGKSTLALQCNDFMLQCNDDVTKCNTEIEIEIEIEKELEIETETEKEKEAAIAVVEDVKFIELCKKSNKISNKESNKKSTPEIRDKRLEIRDKSLENKNNNKNKEKEATIAVVEEIPNSNRNFIISLFLKFFDKQPSALEESTTNDIIQEYGIEELKKAFQIAYEKGLIETNKNKINFSYIKGILRNEKNGIPKQGDNKNGNNKQNSGDINFWSRLNYKPNTDPEYHKQRLEEIRALGFE